MSEHDMSVDDVIESASDVEVAHDAATGLDDAGAVGETTPEKGIDEGEALPRAIAERDAYIAQLEEGVEVLFASEQELIEKNEALERRVEELEHELEEREAQASRQGRTADEGERIGRKPAAQGHGDKVKPTKIPPGKVNVFPTLPDGRPTPEESREATERVVMTMSRTGKRTFVPRRAPGR